MNKKKNKKPTSSQKSLLLLAVSIGFSQLAGIIGSFSTMDSITGWYSTLQKPSFNPPNWVFGPVWILLYTVMGIALFLIWKQLQKPSGVWGWFKYQLNRKKLARVQSAVVFFLLHLVVNSLWSLVFFGMQNLAAALVVIVLLWFMIALLVKEFYSLDKRAAFLLVPYLAWVSFATVLNYSLLMLN